MRALVLAAALLSSCGGSGAPAVDGFIAVECFPAATSTCQLWFDVPQLGVPFLWTCTTGIGHPDEGKPDHRPCVLCTPRQAEWCEAGTGACVSDCSTCTPAAALALNPSARCVAVPFATDAPDLAPMEAP